jgi:DNA-cytosine methyltransferase
MAGSPCQGFSFAGKQLAFDDPRSKLFFDFVDIKNHCEPEYYLLENVKMKQLFQDVISEAVGNRPYEINSSLVSAQNRLRDYWSNFLFVEPSNKKIHLRDILECKTSNYVKVSKKGVYKRRQSKASCLTGGGNSGGNHSDMDLIGRPIELGHATDINGHDLLKRIYAEWGKSPTLTAICGGNQHRKIALNNYEYRRLTPVECERLQTVPDNYTEGVSNTQRYKMLGNGWTVDVIVHILKGINQ